MSTRPRRIEVITGVDRRRRWTLEQKQAIVEESLSGHAAVVARKHGIGTGQLYTWRHQLLGSPRSRGVRFARVELTAAPAQPDGLIEIALPDQTVVRINGAVDAGTLRHVLAALRPS
jgi:transposase